MLISDWVCDAEGFLRNPEEWTWEFSAYVAVALGLELDEECRQLIHLVRDFYQRYGHGPSMRPLVRFAQQQVSAEYSSLRLAQRFPVRPAYTLARMAGIPKPPHCL